MGPQRPPIFLFGLHVTPAGPKHHGAPTVFRHCTIPDLFFYSWKVINKSTMARKRQNAKGSDLVGRPVEQAAREFGRAWAQAEFGDAWETAMLSGTVSSVGGNGTTTRKPVLIEWANGDEEAVSMEQAEAILVSLDVPAEGPPLQ